MLKNPMKSRLPRQKGITKIPDCGERAPRAPIRNKWRGGRDKLGRLMDGCAGPIGKDTLTTEMPPEPTPREATGLAAGAAGELEAT